MFDIDTGAVRHLAGELTERAAEIRSVASDLARQVSLAPWHGQAADAMRELAGLRLAALAGAAGLHDDAAQALLTHAAAVDAAVALLADVAGAVDTAVDTVVDGAVDGAQHVAGAVADHTIGLLR